MYYANQRHIKISKETVSNKNTGRLYLIAYQDNIQFAMKDLGSSAFKCYLVLLMQKDGFILDYSPLYISQVANVSRITASKAMKELQDKGYLVQVDDKHFNFFEYPRFVQKKTVETEERREIIDNSTGEIFVYTFSELRQFVNEETALKLWKEGKTV